MDPERVKQFGAPAPTVLLWLSTASICALTFVWPIAVSADPEQPAFKLPAVATLVVFFAAVLALLARRIRQKD